MTIEELVDKIAYKPGFTFKIARLPGGRTLSIMAETIDSALIPRPPRGIPPAAGPDYQTRRTQHLFQIPPEPLDAERWVYECLRAVETHELGEFFRVDGERPFMPYHEDELDGGVQTAYSFVDRRET